MQTALWSNKSDLCCVIQVCTLPWDLPATPATTRSPAVLLALFKPLVRVLELPFYQHFLHRVQNWIIPQTWVYLSKVKQVPRTPKALLVCTVNKTKWKVPSASQAAGISSVRKTAKRAMWRHLKVREHRLKAKGIKNCFSYSRAPQMTEAILQLQTPLWTPAVKNPPPALPALREFPRPRRGGCLPPPTCTGRSCKRSIAFCINCYRTVILQQR